MRLTKKEAADEDLAYIISIPVSDEAETAAGDSEPVAVAVDYRATFEFQLESLKPMEDVPVLTGTAAVQELTLSYDEPGWEVHCPTAVRVESVDVAGELTQVKVLLGPDSANLLLRPKVRDVTTEETRFFVEGSNLYLPGPGVVDGHHRLHICTSQGQVSELNVLACWQAVLDARARYRDLRRWLAILSLAVCHDRLHP